MSATQPNRRHQEFRPLPARPFKVSPGIAAAIADDARFFKNFPTVKIRVRRATEGEIKHAQEVERRLLSLDPGCEVVAMVGRAEGRRRRLIITACTVDFERMTTAALEELFDRIVRFGWTEIETGGALS